MNRLTLVLLSVGLEAISIIVAVLVFTAALLWALDRLPS